MLSYLNKSENSIAILFSVAILTLAFPLPIPVFGPLAIAFVILKAISHRFKIKVNIGIILYISLILFYFIGLIWTDKYLYSSNYVDILNIIGFLLFWVLLSDLDLNQYKKMLYNTMHSVSVLTLILSVIALIKFLLYLTEINLSFLYNIYGSYPSGTSLMMDYNMFSLALSAGLIFSFYLFKNTKNHTTLYSVTFALSYIAILFAGSRRGWIALIIVSVLLFVEIIKMIPRLKFRFRVEHFIIFYVFVFIAFIALVLNYFGVVSSLSESQEVQRILTRFQSLFTANAEDNLSNRTLRWDYALELYANSTQVQMLFGSGFDYLSSFPIKFNVPLIEDYPHNPILSSLLYGGLVSLIPMLFLFIYIFSQLFKYKKIYSPAWFWYFIIVLAFVMISRNSIFSIEYFSLIVLIIFAIPKKNITPQS